MKTKNENSLAYAMELAKVYWMGLTHPKQMAAWGDALQDVIAHDHERCNLYRYLVVRHNETGIIHIFGDLDMKRSVYKDIEAGIYTVVSKNVEIKSNPTPLTMDRLIPFVIGNYTLGTYTRNLDVTRIPSPLSGYISTIDDLLGDTTTATLIKGRISHRFDDFKMLDTDYVIGFLRLKTNKLEDGIEYAYLYHGSKNPNWAKGLHIDLVHALSMTIDSQSDFISYDIPSYEAGKLPLPIWPTHSLLRDVSGSMSESRRNSIDILKSYVNNIVKTVDSHPPLFAKMYNPLSVWGINKDSDELEEKFIFRIRTGQRISHVPYANMFALRMSTKFILGSKPVRYNWMRHAGFAIDTNADIFRKGIDYRPENFGDPGMNQIHYDLTSGNQGEINQAYLDLLHKYDTVYYAGETPGFPVYSEGSNGSAEVFDHLLQTTVDNMRQQLEEIGQEQGTDSHEYTGLEQIIEMAKQNLADAQARDMLSEDQTDQPDNDAQIINPDSPIR